MTLAVWVAIGSVIGAVVAILTVVLTFLTYRQSRTRAEDERIQKAIEPWKRELDEVTKDRDYYRRRTDELNTELRGKEKR